jgi:hypothetical protein
MIGPITHMSQIDEVEAEKSPTLNPEVIDDFPIMNDEFEPQKESQTVSLVGGEEEVSTVVEEVQPAQQKHWNIIWVTISTFFLTVATVLGTGILALPVKLEKSGFFPFLSSFTIGLFAQSLVLVYMVELLQKTQAIMVCVKKIFDKSKGIRNFNFQKWSIY